MRVCVRERERDRVTSQHISYLNRGLCVCLRERQRERDRVTSQHMRYLNCGLCANTYELHVSVTRLCSPFGLELMVKLGTLLTVFTFNFESWSLRLWKGALHFWRGLWCSANHNALCQLANQSRLCLLEGNTVENEAFERGPTIMYSIWKVMFFEH